MAARKKYVFIGVTTAASSINRLFPLWMKVLGREDVELIGVDHPLNDRPEAFRRTIQWIKSTPELLGGLVTSHKLSLTAAAHDLFDELDPIASFTREVSCIAKRDGRLLGFAKDPMTSGQALSLILDAGYFGRTGGEVLCLGSGGAALATLYHLMTAGRPGDRPRRFVAVDIDQGRLDHLQWVVDQVETDIEVVCRLTSSPLDNDRLLEQLPPFSLVINATGMGKDRPGSPLTEKAIFPQSGVVWEFNYRGERPFYHLARAQAASRQLTVVDGWDYFIFGQLAVIAEVLQIELNSSTIAAIQAVSKYSGQEGRK